MIGYKTCPEWLKTAYKKAVKFQCEFCHKIFPENELEIHRNQRETKGGTYKPSNVQVGCETCHKLIHSCEPGCR